MYVMPNPSLNARGLLSFAQGFAAIAFATGTALILLGASIPGATTMLWGLSVLAVGTLAFSWDFRKRPWTARMCGVGYAVALLTLGLALYRYSESSAAIFLSAISLGTIGMFAFAAPIWHAVRVEELRGNPLRQRFGPGKIRESNGVQFVITPTPLDLDETGQGSVTIHLQNAINQHRRVRVAATPLSAGLLQSRPTLEFDLPSETRLSGAALDTLELAVRASSKKRTQVKLRIEVFTEGHEGERLRQMPGRILFERTHHRVDMLLNVPKTTAT